MAVIEIWGGIGEYGRACYYVAAGETSFLFDCGINKDTYVLPEIIPEKARKLNYVFLSHSHIDHSLALSALYECGYDKTVILNHDTAVQLQDYLKTNSYIKIQILEDLAFPCTWFAIDQNTRICWGRSGHMPGAVWYAVDVCGKRVFYTGDYNDESRLLHHDDPAAVLKNENVDFAIIDCACGTDDTSYESCLERIYRLVQEVIEEGGSVLFPVHKYGKGMELYMLLKKRFEGSEFVIKGDFFDVMKKYIASNVHWIGPDYERVFDSTSVINNMDECRSIYSGPYPSKPQIIFTGIPKKSDDISMWLFEQMKKNSKNMIVFTSRQSKGSIGGRILINTDFTKVKAVFMNVKAHQSSSDVIRLLERIHIKKAVLCHADKHLTTAANRLLHEAGYKNITTCHVGDILEF